MPIRDLLGSYIQPLQRLAADYLTPGTPPLNNGWLRRPCCCSVQAAGNLETAQLGLRMCSRPWLASAAHMHVHACLCLLRRSLERVLLPSTATVNGTVFYMHVTYRAYAIALCDPTHLLLIHMPMHPSCITVESAWSGFT